MGRREALGPYLADLLDMIHKNGKDKRINVIGDADFLFHLCQSKPLFKNVQSLQESMKAENSPKSIILTPNAVEFERLCDMLEMPKMTPSEKD